MTAYLCLSKLLCLLAPLPPGPASLTRRSRYGRELALAQASVGAEVSRRPVGRGRSSGSRYHHLVHHLL
jgi:hypothetical protein